METFMNPISSRRSLLTGAVATAVGAVATTAHAAQSCKVSNGDILGPFFLPGSAQNGNATIELAKTTEAGDHIVITGRVLAPDCKTPIAGAMVDVWQANAKGAYDIAHPDEKIAPANYNLRGQSKTNDKGEFVLKTVMPGRYNIPPGLPGLEKEAGQLRPAHIHLTVIHPIFVPLTTQLYFKGDSQIKGDPWAKGSKVIVEMKGKQGRIDIVLASGPLTAGGKA
jgi:catechol 1,2-dioxygenase